MKKQLYILLITILLNQNSYSMISDEENEIPIIVQYRGKYGNTIKFTTSEMDSKHGSAETYNLFILKNNSKLSLDKYLESIKEIYNKNGCIAIINSDKNI